MRKQLKIFFLLSLFLLSGCDNHPTESYQVLYCEFYQGKPQSYIVPVPDGYFAWCDIDNLKIRIETIK